jgi:hypothetical protein
VREQAGHVPRFRHRCGCSLHKREYYRHGPSRHQPPSFLSARVLFRIRGLEGKRMDLRQQSVGWGKLRPRLAPYTIQGSWRWCKRATK